MAKEINGYVNPFADGTPSPHSHRLFTQSTRRQVPEKDHAFPLRCLAAIIAGSALMAGAILMPVHSLIAATFVLAMALSGLYALGMGIHLLFKAKDEAQEEKHCSTMGISYTF